MLPFGSVDRILFHFNHFLRISNSNCQLASVKIGNVRRYNNVICTLRSQCLLHYLTWKVVAKGNARSVNLAWFLSRYMTENNIRKGL